jgi:GNAT superfamily N-acetyltransferase
VPITRSLCFSNNKIAFAEADELVRDTFIARGIEADLSRVVESGFTVDLAIKQSFHSTKQEITPDVSEISKDRVLGACLFVFMKKFVWIEEVAVSKESQGMGVGKVMIGRMKEVARAKGKDLLLYGITEAGRDLQELIAG